MRAGGDEVRDRVTPPDEGERDRVRGAIRALARPRLAGSEGADETAGELRERFGELGYEIDERPFEFSAWPGRFGLPFAGALLAVGAAVTAWLLYDGNALAALLIAIATIVIIGGLLLLAPTAIRGLPWQRVETENWLVRRPDARPRYLVMAHRDSKSQLIPLSIRMVETAVAVIAWAALFIMAVLAVINPAWRSEFAIAAAGAAAVLTAFIFILSWADNDSPGALDNASGLAALLGVARRMREAGDVAFLITDGEELGLAGARAIAGELPSVHGIINLDGLDDEGEWRVIEGRSWPRRGGSAPHLVATLLSAASALDVDARRAGVPPGILLDHLPLLDADLPAVTLTRGEWSSLGRVHRPGDDVEHMSGAGAADAVAMVGGALELLRQPRRAPENVLPAGLRGR